MPQKDEIRYANGFDETTLVMVPMVDPTYRKIMELPDDSEIVVVWADDTMDGYNINAEFRLNMMETLGEAHGNVDDRADDIKFLLYVTPNKMSAQVREALRTKTEEEAA